ncbi:hypothetical protein OAA83_03255 [Candidatus Marinimicrobia bacterium]|nr:hypothetical protein [Candidatus Neomarinimicrobiota bacterium]
MRSKVITSWLIPLLTVILSGNIYAQCDYNGWSAYFTKPAYEDTLYEGSTYTIEWISSGKGSSQNVELSFWGTVSNRTQAIDDCTGYPWGYSNYIANLKPDGTIDKSNYHTVSTDKSFSWTVPKSVVQEFASYTWVFLTIRLIDADGSNSNSSLIG